MTVDTFAEKNKSMIKDCDDKCDDSVMATLI
jgi:hypothetical protein